MDILVHQATGLIIWEIREMSPFGVFTSESCPTPPGKVPWPSWRQRLKTNVPLGVVEQTCASSPLHGMYGRRKRKVLTVFQGSRVTEPCLLPMVKSLTFFHGEIDNTQAFQTA